MNLKTFKADNEQDRKEAECFIGCRATGLTPTSKKDIKFIGFDDYGNDTTFFGVTLDYGNTYCVHKITIDLDTCQPCIYMAMKHGLDVDIEFTHNGKYSLVLSDIEDKLALIELLHLDKIKSIKLLEEVEK